MFSGKKNKEIYFDLILKYLFDDHPLKKKKNPPFDPRDALERTHKKTDLLKAPTNIL